jgi:ankyrin repeat protein
MIAQVDLVETYDKFLMSEGARQNNRLLDVRASLSGVGTLLTSNQTLVHIYVDLLQFYLAALKLLKSGSFFVGLQKSQFKQDLSNIVSSFKEHTNKLHSLIYAETYIGVEQIISRQDDDFIRGILDNGFQSKTRGLEKALEQRSDQGCLWLTATDEFRTWRTSPGFCILFGDTGSGKSVMASFVVKTLTGSAPLVCAFYCKDDNETNKVLNIYRSVLYQVLQRMEALKNKFLSWYKEHWKMHDPPRDPTLDDTKLREFLAQILRDSRQQVFLVFDGVDECDYDERKHLFEFLKTFSGGTASSPIHIFLSCRPDQAIEDYVTANLYHREILRMRRSRARDQSIAKYHIEQNLAEFPQALLDFLVEKLAIMANGSAIWLKMIIEYLRKDGFSQKVKAKARRKMDSEETLERFIERKIQELPPPQELSSLYKTIFDAAAQGEPLLARKIESTLDFLAGCARPVTLEELAAGVTMMLHSERIGSDFAVFEDELEDIDSLLERVSPFVHVSDSDRSGSSIVRLFHQSLKDLVIDRPVSLWNVASSPGPTNRRSKINDKMLEICINFLLLDKFATVDLIPPEQIAELDAMEFFGGFDLGSDQESPSKASFDGSETADPQNQYFGMLYDYAAVFWTDHFRMCSTNTSMMIRDLARLAYPQSVTLRNWAEVRNRSWGPHWNFNINKCDPLYVATLFGSHDFLRDLAESNLDHLELLENSFATAFRRVIDVEDTVAATILIVSSSTGPQLRQGELICESLAARGQKHRSQGENDADWDDVHNIHITHMFLDDNSYRDLLDWANNILCTAAGAGCLPAIQTLFHHASEKPDLADAIVNCISKNERQSIGEAAWNGRTEVVRYLLNQNEVDIGPHLSHRISEGQYLIGYNVLHCAARRGDAEIMEMLVRKVPKLVDQEDKDGNTPLETLIFSQPRAIKAAEVLLKIGRADPDIAPQGSWDSPIRMAVRASSPSMCRLLAEVGADVDVALQVDPRTETLSLKDSVQDVNLYREILKDLAAWSKLSDGKEYLSKINAEDK